MLDPKQISNRCRNA